MGSARLADEELLRALYAEHARPLFGFALRLVGGDRQRAEDVVQETLLRAWRHPAVLAADDRDPRPWLLTVARRIVIDGARARRARPAEVSDRELESRPGPEDVDRILTGFEVADALRGLSGDHRAVLVETYFRDRSVAEAAVVLGIPTGTVKSRSYYALRALRLALEERGVTG